MSWSASHLIIAGITFAVIIGQAIAIVAYLRADMKHLSKNIDLLHNQLEGVRKELSILNQNFYRAPL